MGRGRHTLLFFISFFFLSELSFAATEFRCPRTHAVIGSALEVSDLRRGMKVYSETTGWMEILKVDGNKVTYRQPGKPGAPILETAPGTLFAERGSPLVPHLIERKANTRFPRLDNVDVFFALDVLYHRSLQGNSVKGPEAAKRLAARQLEILRSVAPELVAETEAKLENFPLRQKPEHVYHDIISKINTIGRANPDAPELQVLRKFIRALQEQTGEDVVQTGVLRNFTHNENTDLPLLGSFGTRRLGIVGGFVRNVPREISDYVERLAWKSGVGQENPNHFYAGSYGAQRDQILTFKEAPTLVSAKRLLFESPNSAGLPAFLDRVRASAGTADVMVVPIPPTRTGPSPTEVLAEAVAGQSGWSVSSVLSKKDVPNAESQKEQETLRDRLANAAGAMVVNGNVQGKVVVLVDDVFKSGATTAEATRILIEAGAKSVYVVSASKTAEVD